MMAIVKIGHDTIGCGLPCQPIVGPCTVTRDVSDLVSMLADRGVMWIRGGCWKPRSTSISFWGFGIGGVEWLLRAARANTIKTVFMEVMDTRHIDDVRYVHQCVGFEGTIVLWVGARTSNQTLLEALGSQDEYPVMLKHHPWDTTIDPLLTRAQFVTNGEMKWDDTGALLVDPDHEQNSTVLLCVRGLDKRAPDQHRPLRFSPNPEWITELHERSLHPVVWDPSHIAGRSEFVWQILRAGLNRQPEVVMVECWFDRDDHRKALCDGDQAIPISQVPSILKMVKEHNALHYGV